MIETENKATATEREEQEETPSVAAELGEVVEYARILVKNHLELAKVEGAEAASIIAGGAFLVLIGTLSAFFLSIGLTVLACMYLAAVLESIYLAIILVLAVYALVLVLVVWSRERVIYSPLRAAIFRVIEQD